MVNFLKKYYILFPLILLFLYLIFEKYFVSSFIIIKGIIIIFILILLFIEKLKSIYVYFSFILLLYLVFLVEYNNLALKPAIEDGVRYFFPFIAISYGFLLIPFKKQVISLFLFFIIFNDVYQVLDYIFMPLITSSQNYELHRVNGLLKFFDFFGFINLIGLMLINEICKKNKFSNYLSLLFIFFAVWSFSYKNIGLLLLYLILRARKLLIYFTLMVLPLFILKYKIISSEIILRINRYLIINNSTRSESYRIVFDNFKNFIFLGQGPGVFGGPASTKYNSDFYNMYHFNWYFSKNISTTDTFYPHLFVELGLVFAVIYLFIILIIPLIKSKLKITTLIVILFITLNSLFTFAFNSLEYCFFSFMLIPLMSNERRNSCCFFKFKKIH